MEIRDMTIYGVDFGTGDALAIHGPSGPVLKRQLKLSKVKGGRTPAMEFIMVADALMSGGDDLPPGDIVVESATIGSSGCEVEDIVTLLQEHRSQALYTISNRAVKNYRIDHKLEWRKGARYAKDGAQLIEIDTQPAVHIEDAEIIYRIAVEHPERLYRWFGPSKKLERAHTSVRPMDKRGYRDDRAEMLMAMLPPYPTLPDELRDVLGNGKEYSRSMVMPFALATQEPHLDDGPKDKRRRRYEKVIGLYDRGYPSFYRRATIVWMQSVAKELAGVSRIAEVPQGLRKQAHKLAQRQIRWFFHLTMQHQGR
jgi:hypothetical protein